MATKKYLDLAGLTTFKNKLDTTYVIVEAGKGLSTNDYTDADKNKLAGITAGAEPNTIETVKVNNTALTPDANKAVNITVPTTAAEVNALADSTLYGATFEASINSSTYVMTMTLKDQNGDALGQAQTIDLPLESVVVSGSYDDNTKKIILTLQNGSTVDFSVADLVSGLQSEITSTNKLGADLVDDTTATHKFVTATEKSAINTALQPNDNVSSLTNDAGYITNAAIPTIDTTFDATSTNAATSAAIAGYVADEAATVAITTAEINALFA